MHYSSNPGSAETSDAITKTLNAGAYVTVTMSTYEAIAKVWNHNESGYQEMLDRPGVEFTNQIYKPAWESQFENRYNQPGSLFGALDFQKEYVKRFNDAGIPLLLGTDSPVIVGMAAGFSIHEEMRMISEAGISNADILKMGTKNFGEFVKKYSRNKEDFGAVKEGYRADLVLLDANPIMDLNTLKDPAYVVVRGRTYSQEYLKSELQKLMN
ncbi:MAG: amidohydrolase family protein [Cyclobacteriaceae bacterium]